MAADEAEGVAVGTVPDSTAVPAAVRAILNERRQALAPPKPDLPAVELPVPALPPPQTLTEIREAFQQKMFALLSEPEVIQAMRAQLRSRKNAKGARELLGVILPALCPQEKGSGGGGATKVTLLSKVDRPGSTTAIKVETGG